MTLLLLSGLGENWLQTYNQLSPEMQSLRRAARIFSTDTQTKQEAGLGFERVSGNTRFDPWLVFVDEHTAPFGPCLLQILLKGVLLGAAQARRVKKSLAGCGDAIRYMQHLHFCDILFHDC